MKKIAGSDFISLGSAAAALIGGILVACHIQLVGLIVIVVSLIVSIVAFCRREKMNIKAPVAYWSLVFCAALTLVGLLGFAGWTVWDIYAGHDVG